MTKNLDQGGKKGTRVSFLEGMQHSACGQARLLRESSGDIRCVECNEIATNDELVQVPPDRRKRRQRGMRPKKRYLIGEEKWELRELISRLTL